MAKQASEEITYFLDHLKKTWFYFALLLFRLLRLLGDLFLTLFYLAFSSLIFVFINALRIIVLALISIYFIIKFLVPIRAKKNPLCVGLDPRWDSLPLDLRRRHGGDSLESIAAVVVGRVEACVPKFKVAKTATFRTLIGAAVHLNLAPAMT